MAPLVAKAHGSGDTEALQDRVGEAIFLAGVMGLLGMFLLTLIPDKVLGLVLPPTAPAKAFALPYLKIRGYQYTLIIIMTIKILQKIIFSFNFFSCADINGGLRFLPRDPGHHDSA